MPAIVAAQLLSSLLVDTAPVQNNRLLRSIFGGRPSLPTLALTAFMSLRGMRDTMAVEFENELKSYVGLSKHKEPENPLTIVKIGGAEQTFTDLDCLAEFFGAMSVPGDPDRASRSFDAARRTAVLGWADSYILRTAEFLATRSLEQSMHVLFPEQSSRPGNVTGLKKTRGTCLNKNGTSKPVGEPFIKFVQDGIPEIGSLHDLLDTIIEDRDNFAHRCEAEDDMAWRLDLAPFQLARICLQYRKQTRP